jgi:hypothetical protein
MHLCFAAIEANRLAFATIRGHLYRTRRLTRADADRMLARVARIELPTGARLDAPASSTLTESINHYMKVAA